MPTTQSYSKSKQTRPAGFDVTCVIGHVEFSELGEDHPYVAAMRCIVEHGAGGGTYVFPSENDGNVEISIPAAPGQPFAGE